MSQTIRNKIHSLIEEGKTLDVLQDFKEIFSKSDQVIFNEIVLLISRWNDIEKRLRLDTISPSEAMRQKTKISSATLEYLDKLPITPSEKKSEVEKNSREEKSALSITRFLLFCVILIILCLLSYLHFKGSLASELSYPQESIFGILLYGQFAILLVLFLVFIFPQILG
ncbi:MAG: hypothetical protein H6559_21505 [Lewinellaceae bacterium]|nr:hypothetical protein [Lewinellaceae bacterium]